MTPDWSMQQQEALAKAVAWLRLGYQQTFYLAGFAGTGKSTLAKFMAAEQKGKVRFAAFTGKAARVMRDKGCAGAKTIHSMIYDTEQNPVTGEIVSTLNRDALRDVALVVVDEVSMVNEDLGKDLLSYGVPVLVLGDPAQLPPISGAGYFTARQPDYLLTEIHRQAKDSPIVRLATDVREGKSFGPMRAEGLTICRREDLDQKLVTDADIVIVGANSTRARYNARLRELNGFDGPDPVVGENLICIRNAKIRGADDRPPRFIANGEIYRVVSKGRTSRSNGARVLSLNIDNPETPDDPPFKVRVREEFFAANDQAAKDIPWKELNDIQQFNFGLAITAHKAQGSQWGNVCVFDESRAFGANRRQWLYTAVTRAANHLTLVMQ